MPFRHLPFVFLAALFLCLAPPARATQPDPADIIGTILEVEGSASVKNANASGKQAADVNMPVHTGDIITTGVDSRVYVVLIDNTELTLAENGELDLKDYNFDDQDSSHNSAVYRFAKGAFLYVSGLVAKRDNPDVTVEIPQGSIGIRGTKFWGGDIDGAYGVIVGEGHVTVKTGTGSIELAQGQGTTLRGASRLPEAAALWPKDKLDRAIKSITLKNPAAVGQRIKQNEPERMLLRKQHRDKLIKRLEAEKKAAAEKAKISATTGTTTDTPSTPTTTDTATTAKQATSTASDAASAATTAIKGTAASIQDTATSATTKTLETVKATAEKAVGTATEAAETAKDTATTATSKATDTIKDATGEAKKTTGTVTDKLLSK